MLNIKTGNLINTERKFICTNEKYLNKYLDTLDLSEEFEITQFYDNNIKYRKILKNNEVKYTSNLKNGNITNVKEIKKNEFLKHITDNKIIKKRKTYIDKDYIIDVDYFIEPKKFIMVEVSGHNLDSYKPVKGLVEVTDIDIYSNKNIFNGSIKCTNVIIEGSDGVGKSLTIAKLLEYGIICQDRLNDVISKNMLFDISMEKRAFEIEKYLLENDVFVIFLINNDKDELMRRIYNRGEISDFDLDAFEYNLLYLDTYKYMLEYNKLHDKLDIVDCTNLNVDEQVNKVRESILNAQYCKSFFSS